MPPSLFPHWRARLTPKESEISMCPHSSDGQTLDGLTESQMWLNRRSSQLKRSITRCAKWKTGKHIFTGRWISIIIKKAPQGTAKCKQPYTTFGKYLQLSCKKIHASDGKLTPETKVVPFEVQIPTRVVWKWRASNMHDADALAIEESYELWNRQIQIIWKNTQKQKSFFGHRILYLSPFGKSVNRFPLVLVQGSLSQL